MPHLEETATAPRQQTVPARHERHPTDPVVVRVVDWLQRKTEIITINYSFLTAIIETCRHAEIHRTSDNDEKKSQCPINVGKTPDKMSGISIYPQFVVKSLIFLWFHNELTSSITSSWSKVNKSAIIPETLILPNLPSWLKISQDFPYLWRHIHGNPWAFPGTRSYKREVFWQDRGNEGADWRRTR